MPAPRTLLPIIGILLLLFPMSASAQYSFVRGDANDDGMVDPIGDAVFLLSYGFSGGPTPVCRDAGDSNDDGLLEPIGDAIHLLNWGFTGGPPPPAPYPSCGDDPTPDPLECVGPTNGCDPLDPTPEIVSTPPTTATELVPWIYDVEAVDAPTDTLTHSLPLAPAGAAIDPTTGLIEWTPQPDQVGLQDFTVRVEDQDGHFDEQTWQVDVEDVDGAPEFVSTPVTTATEAAVYTYDADAIDPDGDPITYALTVTPIGATIDPSTGVVTWTPTAVQAESGVVSFAVRARAGVLDTYQPFNVSITNVNQAPTIITTPVLGAVEGVPYVYDVTASDPDPGDLLSYALTAGPSGATIDPVSGLVMWTPPTDGIDVDFTVVASDDATPPATDEQSWTVSVLDENGPPTITSTPPLTATELVPYVYDVEATDPDAGDITALVFSLVAAPAGATIDPVTGLIEWVPDADRTGSQGFVVRVEDPGLLTDEQAFVVAVADVNQPPAVVSTAPLSATEGLAYQYDVEATDPDPGDVLSYSLDVAPAGATIDPVSGLIGWTPSAAQGGTVQDFTVRVTDDGVGMLSTTQSFAVSVTDVNQPPVITSVPPTAGTEGQLYTHDFEASDPDPGDTLTFSLFDAPVGAFIDGASGLLTWSPDFEQAGPHPFTILVTDSGGLEDDLSFTVVVADVNRPPTIVSVPVVSATVLVPYATDIDAVDPDAADTIAYSLVAAPAGAVIDPVTGWLDWTPDCDQVGDALFTVRATDDGGLSDDQSFVVSVTSDNSAPEIISTPPTTAAEGTPYTYDVDAVDPDVCNTSLVHSLEAAPAGATIDATSGLLIWTPGYDQAGSHSFTVSVSDDGALSAQQSFTVVVANTNRPPVITSSPGTSATVDAPYLYDVSSTDPDSGDTLTHSLPVAPAGATVDASSGLVEWTPTAGQLGSHPVTVRVADLAGAFDEQSFTVVVEPGNLPPSIVSVAPTTADEGVAYSYDVEASDPNAGDTLVHSLPTAPSGASVHPGTGLILWTPGPAQVGTNDFTVRVTDAGGLFDEQSFVVTVSATNDPPVLTSTPFPSVLAGQTYVYDAEASDPDAGDVFSFSLTAGPAGASIDPASGLLSWTTGAGDVGTHPFAVRVTDAGGLFDQQSFSVEVLPDGGGSPGDVIVRVNCGGGAYTDSQGEDWLADTGFNTGSTFTSGSAIAGTVDDPIYQSERWDQPGDPVLEYSFAVPDPGEYLVRLHFAEVYSGAQNPGQRVFDVTIEGAQVLDDYDAVASVGYLTADIREFSVTVTDGSVEIAFLHVVQNPKISGIEVFLAEPQGVLSSTAATLPWGHVPVGGSGGVQTTTLSNPSAETVLIDALEFAPVQGMGHEFEATLAGTTYSGGHASVVHPVNVTLAPGASTVVAVEFLPTVDLYNEIDLVFRGNFPSVAVTLIGTGGNATGHPFLHVVPVVPAVVVDYDQDGVEDVPLDGSDSHTHEPGRTLVAWEWTENGVVFATDAVTSISFPVGPHTVALTIYDDNAPPETLTETAAFTVAPIDAVPGVLRFLYDAGAGDPVDLIDLVPAEPDHASQVDHVHLDSLAPFAGNVMARFVGDLEVPATETYVFSVTGGSGAAVFVDGMEITGPVPLAAGAHAIDVRVAVDGPAQLPVELFWTPGAGPTEHVPGDLLTHDLGNQPPVVNSIFPLTGDEGGGNTVDITGLGFFLGTEVTVQWGATSLSEPSITVTPETISLVAPPGSGVVPVSVSTPRGTSRTFLYDYQDSGPLPISFSTSTIASVGQASSGEWGPDGRLYIGSRGGSITILTFDDDYNVIDTQIVTTIGDQLGGNDEILGITFNPHDPPDPVKLYVGSGDLYSVHNTGLYPGQITVLTGPNFDTAVPLVTGLPVSGIDHSINGLQFDNNGDLYINIGGNTNMGVPGSSMNNFPASPLSGAMVRANTSLPGFNGTITYVDSVTGLPSNDSRDGETVDVAPGVDVEVFGHGLRNPYDLVWTTWGYMYSTDNGPNTGFGPESTDCGSQVGGSGHPDELNLVEYGKFYGHVNRNRGRTDPRQCIHRPASIASIPGVFEQQIWGFPSSTDGIVEYRATTFNNAMRGDLIVQKYNGSTSRIVLSADKRSALQQINLPFSFGALDVCAGPGGVLFGMKYGGGSVEIAQPNDPSSGMRAFDIFPWRAPATGGHPFILGGQGFGTDVASTSVTIGGIPATVTAVSDAKIRGILPADASPSTDLVDVVVTANGETRIITQAFRFLLPPGSEPNN